ncbi:MAG: DNA-directed RNA polymerase subunit beta' [Candidatus Kerfeldbacteria bacterium]|nr:DNA-directed RNA polymerase subunit beta' [Candidatus Kerfeldbacteria bacterium]
MLNDDQRPIEFEAIRLKLASPDAIHGWSYGEVTKPETINYRTQKPEKSGLFAEEIFGPSKDWECYCGKYKRIRYKGIICDKCGVEVTRSVVRRERMGHIDLAAPVSHIWFLRGVPSKIGMILGLSVQDLEKVIYFANFVVTRVDEMLRKETLAQIDSEYAQKKKTIDAETHQQTNELNNRKTQETASAGSDTARSKIETTYKEELENLTLLKEEKLKTLDAAVTLAKKELKELKKYDIISENTYQDLSLKYGHVFEAGIGAETVRHLLAEIRLEELVTDLEKEIEDSPPNKKRRLVRRLKLVRNFIINGLRPEWMILTAIPVIPPDLRPMVQLDGGRFATSDLNDLYRRVINRNNRLKRLIELNAPEVITRNEKRMLQEAVDALIDNGARHGKTVTASTGQKRMLKSIADMLKGKQGRFRQNLLGKRVDYSGRSVIVVGPHLKLYQCGLPKLMALELFRPFVIAELIKREYVHNVRSASRFIESGRNEVWDILEEITKKSHVLLNRAPTLHRLGIQAFQPILIEGKAIQIHPLVCTAFNADFDGDQMAVHVPLTDQAKWEASELMLSSRNLLKPATGTPVVTPTQDMVLGCFYLTMLKPSKKLKAFAFPDEAVLAYTQGYIGVQDAIMVRMDGERLETSVGRILFNRILPSELGFLNVVMTKKSLSDLVARTLRELGIETTVQFVDSLKKIGFEGLTISGISLGMDDLTIPADKQKLIDKAQEKVDEIQGHYEAGLLTKEERHVKIVEIWVQTRDAIQQVSKAALDTGGSVYAMIESGARGSWAQITQMMGMKGPVANAVGETIELPIKRSFKEGFDVLEYFIATHGTRKGLSDTALRTANAGYLTRRLIDVAQDVVVTMEDCGTKEGVQILKAESEEFGETLASRVLGRTSLERVAKPRAKKPVVDVNGPITEKVMVELKKLDLASLTVRSVLTCEAPRGICQKCYGFDLGYNRLVAIGTAVGIIAAQSIGEPGTQLTMRTFHTGGVAGQDITHGLPRVEELFECRPVRRPAILSDVAGSVEVTEEGRARTIRISYQDSGKELYDLEVLGEKGEVHLKVASGDTVSAGTTLFVVDEEPTKCKSSGTIKLRGKMLSILHKKDQVREFQVPPGIVLWVKPGDLVGVGTQLTEGSLDLQELYRLSGKEAVQKYILKEIQYIYSSQGQKLNDKHIETIIRQMFSRVYIDEPGDTDLLSGEMVTIDQVLEANRAAKESKKAEATFARLLLGITKASLSTESFLSAASFIETARVLIDAAVSGKVDYLRGLKENVIIGKLIPAGTGFSYHHGGAPIIPDLTPKPQPAEAPIAEEAKAAQD